MLNVSKLSSSYGAIKAVMDLDLTVEDGALVALIGSNGAGKSTTLRTISGLHKPESGTVELDGRDLTGVAAYRVVRAGLAMVPEGRMIVAPLSVAENLELSRSAGRATKKSFDLVYDLFPRLADRRRQIAGSLSGGEQQMLALGRALITEPRLLLLDEPSMGLAPSLVDMVFQSIAEIHRSGQSILLVEQNAELALRIADHAYVIERGRVVIDGSPADLVDSEEVRSAYLG